eukprot:354339_1
MEDMLNELKRCDSIEAASRAQYHLKTYLKMFKIHLDQLNYLFSPHNHDGKKEMLKKETKELDISMWEKLLHLERAKAKEREQNAQNNKEKPVKKEKKKKK